MSGLVSKAAHGRRDAAHLRRPHGKPGAGAAGAFFMLARVEVRAKLPIMPPVFFTNRVCFIGVTVIGLGSMALFAAAVFLPLMEQILIGASPARAGLMVGP